MGARASGAYNSRSNQFALLGRADPITPNILQESGGQNKPIPMGSQLDCKRLIPSRNTSEVQTKFAILLACIMDHVHINVGEIINDQFKQRAKQQAPTLPFPNLVIMLCMRATCPLYRPLDRTVRANSVITLATKTDKEAPVMKREKYTRNMTLPLPLASTHTAAALLHTDEFHSSTPPDLLNISQGAKMNEIQLV
ncbi:hypothetical protein HAX54_020693 [Datura stramonium]|uniref:Putative plant transposon protein domain-containing protein n=1 Tax=Datura stramonium TaxID=4076 RepID=A0ABS8UTZ8_DATST|nr:hypothetical protein [Datura stramonium]